MSRGLGKVERSIVQALRYQEAVRGSSLREYYPELSQQFGIPVSELAYYAAYGPNCFEDIEEYWPSKPATSVYSAVCRAVRLLEHRRLIATKTAHAGYRHCGTHGGPSWEKQVRLK